MAPQESGPARLIDIPPTTAWYSLNPQTRGVTILDALWDIENSDSSKQHLSDSARMALALTGACCEVGRGQVFQVHPERSVPVEDQTDLIDAHVAFNGVPSLFYAPHLWTENEVADWNNKEPFNRLEALTSRYGMVDRRASVLPLDVELSTSPFPILDGLKTGIATILFSPVPHVGMTLSMRAACGPVDPESLKFQCLTGWETFREWKREDGLVGVVKTLEELYRSAGSMLVFFGSLQKRLIAANMTATEAGQGYFRHEDNNDSNEDEEKGEDVGENVGEE